MAVAGNVDVDPRIDHARDLDVVVGVADRVTNTRPVARSRNATSPY
jgi:hypothetical protein